MAGGVTQAAQEDRGRLKYWPLGLVVLFLGIAFLGDRGVLHYIKLSQQKASIVATLTQIEEQNNSLRQEITSLRSDRRYIERIARTELGMVRDDELVFQFANAAKVSSPGSTVAQ